MLGMYRRAGYQWSEIAVLMNSSPARLQKTLRASHPPRERTAGAMIISQRSPRRFASDQQTAACTERRPHVIAFFLQIFAISCHIDA